MADPAIKRVTPKTAQALTSWCSGCLTAACSGRHFARCMLSVMPYALVVGCLQDDLDAYCNLILRPVLALAALLGA